MSRATFDGLDGKKLEEFVSLRIEEGTYLDYKSAVSSKMNDAAKKELLKDVSGFANAGGGIIIYGCYEPDDKLTIENQLVGVDDGNEIATTMERIVAASLDPRIPGFGVRPILLPNGKHAIVLFIPSSSISPHMVTFNKKNIFYKRHSESTEAMNAQEVKSAVLNTYNRGDVLKAMHYEVLAEYERSSFKGAGACIVLQAIPLSEPAIRWDVFSQKFADVLARKNLTATGSGILNLRSSVEPGIDVEKRVSRASVIKKSNNWILSAKSNGHVYLMCLLPKINHYDIFNPERLNKSYFHGAVNKVFCSFGAVVDSIQESEDTAHGFKVIAQIDGCLNMLLYADKEKYNGDVYQLEDRDVIDVPAIVAMPGMKVEKVCETIGESIFQAFGVLPEKGVLATLGS